MRKALLKTVLALLGFASLSPACSVCFGAPESNMSQGMNMAIVAMLVIVGAVLAAFGAFFIYLNRRGKLAGTEG